MEELSLSVYYFAVPPYIRLTIILFIVFMVLRKFILWGLLWIVKGLTFVLEGLFVFIYYIYLTVMSWYVKVMLKKGKRNFTGLNKTDDFFGRVVPKVKDSRRRLHELYHSRTFVMRARYRNVLLFGVLVLGFVLYQWPEGKFASEVTESEKWLLAEKMKLEYYADDRARELVSAKMKEEKIEKEAEEVMADEVNAESAVVYQLTSDYPAAKLREQPVYSDDIPFKEVYQEDELTFLNEEQADSGITFLKVEVTRSGDVGWISENIVEAK